MLKTAVIGLGSMGGNHARLMKELSDLRYVVDTNVGRVKTLGRHYAVDHLTDYRALFKKDIDAVSLVVPTNLHHRIGKDLLEHGINVLIEKPITYDVEEGKELVAIAEREGLVLCVGHIERYNPIVRFAKEAITRGEFGKVISLNSRRVSSYPSRVTDVGVIMDLAIHDLDVQKYLAESEVASIVCLAGITRGTNYESHANILMEFKNGIIGHIETNWLTPIKIRTLNLTCSEKFATIDYVNQTCAISSSKIIEFDVLDSFLFPQEVSERMVYLKKEEPLRQEILDFITAVKQKRTPLVDGQDGIDAVIIAQAAIESYKKKKRIYL